MKCPKCLSADTKKVSVRDPAWKVGAQRCQQCAHQDNWGEFCDPPIRIGPNPHRIIIPGMDDK